MLKIGTVLIAVITGVAVPVVGLPADTTTDGKSVLTICALTQRTTELHGKRISVRGRLGGTWEGYYIADPRCESELIDIRVHLNGASPERNTFEAAVAGLCNGMSSNCKFDYIEAEFTGVLHVKKNFRVKEGFGNGFGNMGLSSMRPASNAGNTRQYCCARGGQSQVKKAAF